MKIVVTFEMWPRADMNDLAAFINACRSLTAHEGSHSVVLVSVAIPMLPTNEEESLRATKAD